MTAAASLTVAFDAADVAAAPLASMSGLVLALARGGGATPAMRALDAVSDGQASRALAGATAVGRATVVRAPHGMEADALVLIGAGDAPIDLAAARKIGSAIAKAAAGAKARAAHLRLDGLAETLADGLSAERAAAEIAYAIDLRGYRFDVHKSGQSRDPEKDADADARLETLTIGGVEPEAAAEAHAKASALASGARLARDLVNEPANVLTPETFAERIEALAADGVEVETLDDEAMAALGMNALLGVARGSRRGARLVVMRWAGDGAAAQTPICFVGKGVTFDTGGVSLKPAAGMEEMTMDMGGAAIVVGAMAALARRKSPQPAIGVVGLVENMPDGDAQRPGDVVVSASGKTIEVINTDAEGRLVLADALWYAQEKLGATRIVDLATLTGAMIIALGHETAGFFSNDDGLADALSAAAKDQGEALWRLPLGPAYDRQLKSRIADMKNVGGRPAGSITAAQFLQRFVNEGVAWAHIDVAGVTLVKEEGTLWPRGATGWGVATLTRLAEAGD